MKKLIFIFLLLISTQSLAAGKNSTPPDLLKGVQRDYYIQIFEYAMESVEEDGVYKWNSEVGNGRIRVGKAYRSKSNAVCRNFSETFTINNKNGSSNGTGCRRSVHNNGWCRVKGDDIQSCALEHPQTSVGKTLNHIDGNWADKANELLR